MALLQRFKNLTAYSSWSRLKATFGLLTSDEKQRWLHALEIPQLEHADPAAVLPWYSFGAIDYLENKIHPNMKVLEYGSGFSTLWWSQRTATVSAVERNPQWLKTVCKGLSAAKISNVNLVLYDKLGPIEGDDRSATHDRETLSCLVDEYISAPLNGTKQYDVVIVDDVFRPIVLKQSVEFVRPGGFLILDDSHRQEYAGAMEFLDEQGWSAAHYYGSRPYTFVESQTTIWRKPH